MSRHRSGSQVAHVDPVLGVATKGPKEYRTYKMIKQVYAAIDKARTVIKKLEDELDEKSVKAGLLKFESAATHLMQGVALLFPALYYAEHKDMDAVADGLAGSSGVTAPDEDLFELESAVQIAEIAKNLKVHVHDVGALLESISDSAPLKIAIGAVIFKRDVMLGVIQLAKVAGKGVGKVAAKRPTKNIEARVGKALKNPTVWMILAGVAVASGVVHEVATGGKGTKAVKDAADEIGDGIKKGVELLAPLFDELVSSWPGSTEDRARTHGEIVGGMFGAIAFNKFLFGTGAEKKAAKDAKEGQAHIGQKWIKLNESPIVGSMMKNNLKVGIVGPILSAIFRRYISLFKHLKSHGWPDAPERTEEALGRLLSEAEDAELKGKNFKRLALFKTEKETSSFSLRELVKVLFRLRSVVGKDLKAYLEKRAKDGDIDLAKFLPEEFEAIIDAAKTWGMADLVSQYAPQLYVVMATHMYLALGELGLAIEALFEPFTKSDMSWMTLLHELGLDVGDVDAAVKELNAAKRDDLKSFK